MRRTFSYFLVVISAYKITGSAEILAQDTYRKQLDAAKEKDRHHDRRITGYGIAVEQSGDEDIDQVDKRYKRDADSQVHRYPERCYGIAGHAVDSKVDELREFPFGGSLSFSRGNILGIDCNNKYYFYHSVSTQSGSSGSPIVLENDNKVFAIHKGTIPNQNYNVGIFIGIIVEIMKEYKKNGKFKEFYENGDLKYEGNFKDDEYDDDNGQFYFENGESYIGQFKKGKKHGKGFILDKNQNLLKEDIEYENDIYIDKEKESNNKESKNSKNDNKSENENKKEDSVEENNDLVKNIANIWQNKNFKNCLRKAISNFKPIGDSLGLSFCTCHQRR